MGRPRLDLERITIGVPRGLLDDLDAVAGPMGRADLIRFLIEEGLNRKHGEGVPGATVPVPAAVVPERAPAVARKPVVKRDVGEVAAGGDGAVAKPAGLDERVARAVAHPRYGEHHRLVIEAIRKRPGQGARVLSGMVNLPQLAVERALERLAADGVVVVDRGLAVMA